MKSTSLFHISGGIVKIDNVQIYSNTGSEQAEKKDGDDTDDADSMAVAEARPEQASDISITQPFLKKKVVTLSFIDCIAERETAHILMSWLHLMMDNKDKPKQKLIFLRAVAEGGFFSQTPDHRIYMGEFGPIARSSYHDWMKCSLRYDPREINKLIEQYSIYLTQFPK